MSLTSYWTSKKIEKVSLSMWNTAYKARKCVPALSHRGTHHCGSDYSRRYVAEWDTPCAEGTRLKQYTELFGSSLLTLPQELIDRADNVRKAVKSVPATAEVLDTLTRLVVRYQAIGKVLATLPALQQQYVELCSAASTVGTSSEAAIAIAGEAHERRELLVSLSDQCREGEQVLIGMARDFAEGKALAKAMETLSVSALGGKDGALDELRLLLAVKPAALLADDAEGLHCAVKALRTLVPSALVS